MSCENGKCTGIGCSNFYVENGVPGCLRGLHSTPTAFRASAAQDTKPVTNFPTSYQEILDLMKEVEALTNKYVDACRAHKRAHRSATLSNAERLAVLGEIKRLKHDIHKARRQELTKQHPYGFVEDLGYHFNDASLEAMARATQEPSEFNSYAELADHFDGESNQNSFLANPRKLAALRLAVGRS